MRVIVLSTNFRNIENWLPVFHQLHCLGHLVQAIWLPWLGDPTVNRMRDLPLSTVYFRTIESLDESGLSKRELQFILDEAVPLDVDILFVTDMQNYPSRKVYDLIIQRVRRPLVIGLQHGLYQSWWTYNRHFGADELLCFGPRHVRELLPQLRSRAHPVGLPKLDSLYGLETRKGGYILYLAQRVPEREIVTATLMNVQRTTGLPVVVRNHPQYPFQLVPQALDGFDKLVDLVEISDLSLEQQLASADWIITPHSTAGLEALHLGKPVVLLPNHGLTAWAGYPAIAEDFSVSAILKALERFQTCNREIEIFLDDTLGGMRFDHTERALVAIFKVFEDWSDGISSP